MEEVDIVKSEIESLKKYLELKQYSEEDIAEVMKAAYYGEEMHRGQKRKSGEPYFIHPIAVAKILVEFGLNKSAVTAAVLHDTVEDTDADYSIIETNFGTEVAQLVDSVTKIELVDVENKSVQEAETLRKMLIAMVKDIRVIMIKLADKVHNMRTLTHLKREKQKIFAKDCLEIYVPIAGHLGISLIKTELEDLSLKYINPEVYEQISDFLAAKKTDEEYCKSIEKKLKQIAQKEEMEIEIVVKEKSLYSFYKKMLVKKKPIEEVYNGPWIRVLCDSANDCYAMLGMVHKLWIPIERRFKDYIAVPKANKYRSLHTSVITDNGKTLDIQICTFGMHKTADYGIAAHWLHKKGITTRKLNPQDTSLANKLKQWNHLENYETNFLKDLKKEILKDTVTVFTPDGDILELPGGSTPIDFAYYIHTDVGNHIAEAKADGYTIPLNAELRNTQVIEVITNKNAHPAPYWLKVVKTSKARSRIRHWLKNNRETVLNYKNEIKNYKKKLAEEKKIKKEKGIEKDCIVKKAAKKFKVVARKTEDLFSEIEGAIKEYNGRIIEGTLAESDNERSIGFFTLEIDKDEDFVKAVKIIRTIPSIINIYAI
ncbi:MAG: RelA/SpoT family protein [Spirochaetes bacterium]|nr:RelA/SpoT family protein [Spirochaetota bacterium]